MAAKLLLSLVEKVANESLDVAEIVVVVIDDVVVMTAAAAVDGVTILLWAFVCLNNGA